MQIHPSQSRRAWLWPVLVAAGIFLASSRSDIAAPSIEGSDKVAHFAIYGLLATLMVRLGRGRVAPWIAVLLASVYGVSDEWHQSSTPGRSVEVADWLADTGGATLAVAMYTFWSWYRTLLELPLARHARVENLGTSAKVSIG